MRIHGTDTGRFSSTQSNMSEVTRAPYAWPLCSNCGQSVTGKYGTAYGCSRCRHTTGARSTSFFSEVSTMMRSLLVLIAALTLSACDTTTEPRPQLALALSVEEGAAQRDTVGRLLAVPVVIEATNARSAEPAPSVILNWFRVAGTDTVFSGASLTSSNGRAQFQWRLLNRAGPQSVVAWALDEEGNQAVYVEALAEGVNDRPAVLTLAVPTEPVWLGDALTARGVTNRVADRHGNLVADARATLDTVGGWEVTADTFAVARRLGARPLTVRADTASATGTVTVLRDLRRLVGAQLAYTCGDTTLALPDRDLDYLEVAGTVDSVRYLAWGNPVTREWRIYAASRHVSHSDKFSRWDTTHVVDLITVTDQALDGALTIPYRAVLVPNGTQVYRSDLPSGALPWADTQPQFSGGNGCRYAWQAHEPFTPLTLTPPVAP